MLFVDYPSKMVHYYIIFFAKGFPEPLKQIALNID